jgi:GNAT superfamily N-acetyltransferase
MAAGETPGIPVAIRRAEAADVPLILGFIRGLAEFERLSHEVEATEERLRSTLFPASGPPAAECILAFDGAEAVGFALYFATYSTFLAKPGLYLEDLFVLPGRRGRGIGRALFLHLARAAAARGCGRFEWSVLDWNERAIGFYQAMGAILLNEWTTCRLAGPALDRYRADPKD